MKTNTKEWMDRKPYAEMVPLSEIEESDVETTYWIITPEKAQELIDSMIDNRAVHPNDYMKYAEDIKRGHWSPHSSQISIDPDGHLIDGQHRMHAIIEAGVPVAVKVQLNTPRDTPFDIGRKRSTGDNAFMSGELSKEAANNNHFAIINRLLIIIFGDKRSRTFSDHDKILLMREFGDEIMLSAKLSKLGAGNPLCKNSCVQAGIFSALHSGIPEDILSRFSTVANTCFQDGDKESAATTLYKYLDKTRGNQSASIKLMRTASTEQAIRDFVRGKARTKSYSKLEYPYTNSIADEIKEVLAYDAT